MKIDSFQFTGFNQVKETESLAEKLASGKRINSAADNAAGLQILNRLSGELDALQQGTENAQGGISLAQVAEGSFSAISETSSRIRELTLQAGSGALTDADRQAIQTEIDGLVEQIGETATQSSFGGIGLLDSSGDLEITLGQGSEVSFNTKDVSADLNNFGLNAIDVTSSAGRQSALTALDKVAEYVNESRGDIGAFQNRLDSSIRNINNQFFQISEASSRSFDSDFAKTVSDQVSADILNQGQIAVRAQANISSQQVLTLLP